MKENRAKTTESFGPHLMLDLRKCEANKLNSVAFVFSILSDLPNLIGMTKITQPYVFPYEGVVPEDKGVTGIVIIAESHISVHTFEKKDYVFVDVFSCKDFDVEVAEKYLVAQFESKEYDKFLQNRGVGFPRG